MSGGCLRETQIQQMHIGLLKFWIESRKSGRWRYGTCYCYPM